MKWKYINPVSLNGQWRRFSAYAECCFQMFNYSNTFAGLPVTCSHRHPDWTQPFTLCLRSCHRRWESVAHQWDSISPTRPIIFWRWKQAAIITCWPSIILKASWFMWNWCCNSKYKDVETRAVLCPDHVRRCWAAEFLRLSCCIRRRFSDDIWNLNDIMEMTSRCAMSSEFLFRLLRDGRYIKKWRILMA